MRKNLIFLILALFICTINSISQTKDISYTDLYLAYYENGLSFKNNYLYHDLSVSGNVYKIDRTENDVAYVGMILQNTMFLFYFDKYNENQLKSISAFEWVKIKGRLYMADIFQGSMTFVFRNCILIKNPTSSYITRDEGAIEVTEVDKDNIHKIISGYFQDIQDKKLDNAADCFISSKRSKVKPIIEKIIGETEYYNNMSINSLGYNGTNLIAKVSIDQKRFVDPEIEHWNVTFEFIKSGSKWKIFKVY